MNTDAIIIKKCSKSKDINQLFKWNRGKKILYLKTILNSNTWKFYYYAITQTNEIIMPICSVDVASCKTGDYTVASNHIDT